MIARRRKVKIGIVGCGAIGSRMARSIKKEFNKYAVVSAIFDIDPAKSQNLAKEFPKSKIIKKSLQDLLKNCDLLVEAVNASDTQDLVRRAICAKKDVLAMSVGKLLNAQALFRLARQYGCHLLLPSGAIAGVDAIKAASLAHIRSVTLTTRKPPFGFGKNSYVIAKGINLDKIKSETVLFDGDVDTAVKFFPQNINVAATVALASQARDRMRIRIITSPNFQTNSHEIELDGDFGRIVTRTENVVCPDNPKTSYLAVLSAVQTLKQYFHEVKIGT